jgi:hypothetical protein
MRPTKFDFNPRYVLLGLAAVLVPAAIGCGEDADVVVPASPVNARASRIQLSANGAIVTAYNSARVANDEHSVKYQESDDSTQKDLTGSRTSFAGPGTTAELILTPDIDANGKVDTFLMVVREGNAYSAAYKGPFTPQTRIEELKTASAKATYNGAGGIVGKIATVDVDQTGTLSMTADFGKGEVSGQLSLNAADAVKTGVAYDSIAFGGAFSGSDYSINSVTIKNGATAITDSSGTGIGSFMGADANGTIGTFAKSSPITGTTSTAGIVGYFHGSR